MSSASYEMLFFDIRFTLGWVDRPGHLIPHPTSRPLLQSLRGLGYRLGVISNLPANVSRQMGLEMLREADLLGFFEQDAIVFNHDAGVDKPEAPIYQYAAEKAGLPIERCCYCSENEGEGFGALRAGMGFKQKLWPPGFDTEQGDVISRPGSAEYSGHVFELLLEMEHALGHRIVRCAREIATRLEKGDTPLSGNADRATPLMTAMGILADLAIHFIMPYHHRKEDEVLIPLALARGMSPHVCRFVAAEHAQGENYFRGMELALKRLQEGEPRAARDYALCVRGMAELYDHHGDREDRELFPKIGEWLKPSDEMLILSRLSQIGPHDVRPWIAYVQSMETELNISAA